jgi:predicted ATP-grasp superfamily ATP-dependent carboligase
LRRSSQAEAATLLVAAISARSLAQAARRAGFVPLAADFFADVDTQSAAHACRKLAGDMKRGFVTTGLLGALEALAERAPSPVRGFVYGAGFEDRPELLRAIAKRWPVLGNDAATVKRIKAPDRFFPALARLGIPHPVTVMARPANSAGWLAKKIGGAGGSHIVPSRLSRHRPDIYYQRRLKGDAVSALFVANGVEARVLGFSEQWTAPTSRSLWRYRGALRPADLAGAMAEKMQQAAQSIVRHFKLKGLGSADFLVEDGEAFLLEINPRPGATLDIFDCGATPLLRLHVEAATAGTLPAAALKFDDAMASAIVYAKRGGATRPDMAWPEWTADRPKSSEWIDKNRPICTVLARAETKTRAKRLIKERICKITNTFQTVSRGKDGEQKRRNRRRAPDRVGERQHQGGTARQSADR